MKKNKRSKKQDSPKKIKDELLSIAKADLAKKAILAVESYLEKMNAARKLSVHD